MHIYEASAKTCTKEHLRDVPKVSHICSKLHEIYSQNASKMLPKCSQMAPRDHPWTTSLKKAANSKILGCPWEAIGVPLGPLGSLWGTFGSQLTSLFKEKSLTKHLLAYVTLLIHFFIDF